LNQHPVVIQQVTQKHQDETPDNFCTPLEGWLGNAADGCLPAT